MEGVWFAKRFGWMLVATAAAACTAEEPIRAGTGDVPPPVTASTTSNEVTTTTEELAPTPCQAGDFRTCKEPFFDDYGQKHCYERIQFCAADGSRWLACGGPDPNAAN